MISENKKYNEKYANELVFKLMNIISKFILDVNAEIKLMKYYYEKMNLETETPYIIEDTLGKLSEALASLVTDLKSDGFKRL